MQSLPDRIFKTPDASGLSLQPLGTQTHGVKVHTNPVAIFFKTLFGLAEKSEELSKKYGTPVYVNLASLVKFQNRYLAASLDTSAQRMKFVELMVKYMKEPVGRWITRDQIRAYASEAKNPISSPVESSRPVVPDSVTWRAQETARLSAALPVSAIDPRRVQSMQMGGMYGQAVGDALGLLTEFRTKEQAQSILKFGGSKLRLDFDKGRDSGCPDLNIGHLNGFKLNGWTDDTDQAMCMYRALEQKVGGDPRSEEQLFAQEIVNWRSRGMPGRDAPPSGLGKLVGHVMGDRAVLNDSSLAGQLQKKFLENPHEAAENIWSRLDYDRGIQGTTVALDRRSFANGALMRTSVLPVMYYADFQTLIAKTIQFSKVTHADPRCTACSVAFTLAMAMSMRNDGQMTPAQITHDALEYAKVVLKEELVAARDKGLLAPSDETNMDVLYKQYCEELDQSANSTLDQLQLGTQPIGTAFKCMGSGFWALREAAHLQKQIPPLAPQEIYRQVMTQLIGEGGDADTNGAVAGSMLGVFLGAEAIPQEWRTGLEAKDQAFLDRIIPTFQGIASQTPPAVPKG